MDEALRGLPIETLPQDDVLEQQSAELPIEDVQEEASQHDPVFHEEELEADVKDSDAEDRLKPQDQDELPD